MVFGVGQFNDVIYIYPIWTRCHDNEIWDKIGYNSACVRDISEIFALIGVFFRDGLSNAANQILPWATLVAIARKFGT